MLLDPLSIKRPAPKPNIQASIYVSGNFMTEGSLDQMHSMFDQECASHSASVEVRIMEGKNERTVRRRSIQQ